MSKVLSVLLVIAIIAAVVLVVLYFVGRRLEKKQMESETQMKAASQTVSILVIDKKKMKLKDAGLPAVVLEQTPRYLRSSKVPIVKAKIGPKIMSLICDMAIYDQIPVKKEVKAVISGIYIMDVRGLRSGLDKAEKVGFMQKIKNKAASLSKKK